MFEDEPPKIFLSPRAKTALIISLAFIVGFGAHVFASFLPQDIWKQVKNVLTYSPQNDLSVAEIDLNVGKQENIITVSSAPAVKTSPVKLPAKPAAKKIKISPSPSKSTAKTNNSTSTTLTVNETVKAAPKTDKPQWCKFKTIGKPRGDVLINEVAWMGNEDDANAEWLELKNQSGDWIDISHWQILDKDGKFKIALSTRQISPEGFFLLERESDDTLPDAPADQVYSGSLSNSGEWLKLFDTDCLLHDEIKAEDRWPAGNITNKKTMERKVGADGWQTSLDTGGTPGRQNSVALSAVSYGLYTASVIQAVEQAVSQATSPPAGDANPPPENQLEHVVIAVIQTTGGPGLTDNDFIKIYNPTNANLDVSGWKLRKRTKSGTESSIKVLANGNTVAAHEYFVWSNSKYAAGANATSTATIASDNSIALLDADEKIIDAVAWGADLVNPFKEGNVFAQNPEAPQILKRKFVGGSPKDDNDNASDFSLE